MDILRLYSDYNVDFLTEGHKHCRAGWVNTPCPFCRNEAGHEGYHLGYNIEGNFYVCWRCGWHPVSLSISKLLVLPESQVRDIVRKYGILVPYLPKAVKVKPTDVECKLPTGSLPVLHEREALYLYSRGFDAREIERIWGITSAGPYASLKIPEEDKVLIYKFRILIPFIWNGEMVSFDSRDTSGKALNKYQACPLSREKIPHKEILYCKQEALQDTAICVEGPTDVWRFGFNSFAVSGIKYTPAQVRLIAEMFKRVPVCFDGGEPQAIAQANKLVADLKFRKVDAFRVDIEGDPGSMNQADADYLVKHLMK